MPDVSQAKTDDDNHWTCLLARATGKTMGVAKKLLPVLVPTLVGRYEVETIMAGLGRIIDDTASKKKDDINALSVLLMSINLISENNGVIMYQNVDGSDAFPAFRSTLHRFLKKLVSQNVLTVTSSGNME